MTIVEWSECFSDNLLELLENRCMTQRELARESDVSTGSISAYINKKALPSIKAILNIACALDVDVAELIDFGDTIE